MSVAAFGYGLEPPIAVSGIESEPEAGDPIATTGTLPAGVYLVAVWVRQTGVADSHYRNLVLKVGSTTIEELSSTSQQGQVYERQLTVNGSQAIAIVLGASDAGTDAEYTASILTTRLLEA